MIRLDTLCRCLVAGLLAFVAACAANAGDTPQYLSEAPLVIETGTGAHMFRIEEARSRSEHQKGLMYRPKLRDDGGMLFVYKRPDRMGFWMKNTPEPLDIIFIRQDGTIESVVEDNIPFSLGTVRSEGRVLAALELRGGRAAEIGLKPGDVVRHKIFRNLPKVPS